MKLIPGPTSKKLGERIAGNLDLKPCDIKHRIFPDGESYFKLPKNLKDENVVIVQSTSPNPDKSLLQLFFMVSTARDFGARRIIALVPYLSYARQDKRFLEGESLSLKVVIDLLESSGVNDLVVVDIHNESSLRRIVGSRTIQAHNLSAIPLIASELKIRGYEGAYSLSPDEGAIKLVKSAAEVLGGGSGYFVKKRNRTTGEIFLTASDVKVQDRKAVVFDDIISSGGTMSKAVEALKTQGASEVAAVCTHALFMDGAENRIKKAGADLILSSDTIETKWSNVTIANLLSDFLKTLL
jgi:ribose-phosphate pyrophosphokinase